jgi:hypothetical protein
VDQSIAFNESYAQAVTGQILLNVLRARDRQPRYYLSMTGISEQATSSVERSAGLDGIGLGAPINPWGFASFGGSRSSTSEPAYAVQPFDAPTLNRAVFNPTPGNVFQHYWTGGWPRDILMLVLVDRITRISKDSESVETFDNEANDIADDCAAGIESKGCAFVRTTRDLLAKVAAAEAKAPTPINQDDCPPIGAWETDAAWLTAARKRLDKSCQPRIEIGGAMYVLSLRSFDDAVYYVGELMRPAVTSGVGPIMATQVNVRAAGLKGGGAGVPLFRILSESEAKGEIGGDPRGRFAAGVIYGGERLYAGAPVGRSCAAASASGICADNAAEGDRTSSVLSLLTELLALNQSPDAVRAPTRVLN